MLNIDKFDDINYLEINNKLGEEILNHFYNNEITTLYDKYGLEKTILAIVQLGDDSFGIIEKDNSSSHTEVYGIIYNNQFIETNTKLLLPFKIIDKYNTINTSSIMKHNLDCSFDKRTIKRVFTLDGYSEF